MEAQKFLVTEALHSYTLVKQVELNVDVANVWWMMDWMHVI